MPYVSMFFGIIIRMFHQEHNPPHFHAEYQGQRGMFDFDGKMVKGNLKSRRAKKLIEEWATIHQTELWRNWEQAKQMEQIDRIEPLN
ncbi:MAG: DUF4160 domain-containing protein [Pseudomonadota bacterium]